MGNDAIDGGAGNDGVFLDGCLWSDPSAHARRCGSAG
jgi:hypothetical protein